jgi:hypothetical protein
MEGEDHILSPVSKSHTFSPSFFCKQYIFLSDAAKNTLSLIMPGEAIIGWLICLLHLISPVA